MTDRQSFLASIIANPDDDLARLAYADFLDDRGDRPDDRDRARYVRLTVAAAARPKFPGKCRCEFNVMRHLRPCRTCVWRRERNRFTADAEEAKRLRGKWRSAWGVTGTCTFRRGFIHTLHTDAWHLVEHADRILLENPVSALNVVETPYHRLASTIGLWGWTASPPGIETPLRVPRPLWDLLDGYTYIVEGSNTKAYRMDEAPYAAWGRAVKAFARIHRAKAGITTEVPNAW